VSFNVILRQRKRRQEILGKTTQNTPPY